jgi:voltage-gated potassium channel
MWWSYFTLTTVSYVDRFPVTDAGKFIAALYSICYLALIGTFTAFVAR